MKQKAECESKERRRGRGDSPRWCERSRIEHSSPPSSTGGLRSTVSSPPPRSGADGRDMMRLVIGTVHWCYYWHGSVHTSYCYCYSSVAVAAIVLAGGDADADSDSEEDDAGDWCSRSAASCVMLTASSSRLLLTTSLSPAPVFCELLDASCSAYCFLWCCCCCFVAALSSRLHGAAERNPKTKLCVCVSACICISPFLMFLH